MNQAITLHLEGCDVFTLDGKQAIILFEPVGATYLYSVHGYNRIEADAVVDEANVYMVRQSTSGPGRVESVGVFEFYGAAIKAATKFVGG